jgi:phage recombination protein Bet
MSKQASNLQVVRKESAIPAMAMSEDELINVLRNSLYPGAQTDSIKMVLGYCQAAGLDPMQKPVHIVPIYDGKLKAMRDVVMPGIGLYRTQMSRTGECAGVTEPEFGPDKTETLGGVEITYPSWCKVIVKRILPSGQIADYAATERWKENYAMKGGQEKSIAPNAMWTKRPYAQLAKCAEAQALRKAFPELGSAPTADEMEGKEFDNVQTVEATVRETNPERPTITMDVLIEKHTHDVIDQEGVVTKFSTKSKVQNGDGTAQGVIDFLSAKYILPSEVIAEIQSWEQKGGE